MPPTQRVSPPARTHGIHRAGVSPAGGPCNSCGPRRLRLHPRGCPRIGRIDCGVACPLHFTCRRHGHSANAPAIHSLPFLDANCPGPLVAGDGANDPVRGIKERRPETAASHPGPRARRKAADCRCRPPPPPSYVYPVHVVWVYSRRKRGLQHHGAESPTPACTKDRKGRLPFAVCSCDKRPLC
jgi:hypothetical protein